MSQQPQPSGLDGLTELQALAMDHALGGGSRAERKAAELRLLSDPEVRAAVERWQTLLAPLDDVSRVLPRRHRCWRQSQQRWNRSRGVPRRCRRWPAVGGTIWACGGGWRLLARC